MSKYILSILDAMGNVMTGQVVTQPSKHQSELKNAKTFRDDRAALKSDWDHIGRDFKKSSNTFLEMYGN